MNRFFVSLCLAWLVCLAGASADAQTPVPQILEVPLFPGFDQFGNQFSVVQAYEDDQGQRSITTGIYDTGASVVTFSAFDQDSFFDYQGFPPIPIIPGAVATAEAIGGTIVGKVSQPGRILAAGASAMSIEFDFGNFDFSFNYDLSNAVSVGGIQAFVGTETGSVNLPTIVGTPINVPSATNPGGLATIMDQSGYLLNLADIDPIFGDIELPLPDVRFVAAGTSLVPSASTYESVTIPISLFGVDTTGNPGNEISAAPNPIQPDTSVAFTSAAPGSATKIVANQSFLFDTGAQLSIISPAIAAQLGLTDELGNPLEQPVDVIAVQGAGTAVNGLPGYILDSLTLPRTDGGLVQFTDVPVYVLDLGFGIDGILGMNLFNAADQFIYDPYNPAGAQLSVLFLNDRTDELGPFGDLDPFSNALLELLGSRFALANPLVPGLHQPVPVPEPSTLALAAVLLPVSLVASRRRARRRRAMAG